MKKIFNESLVNSVVVGIDRRYNDNDGDTIHAVIWNGEELSSQAVRTGYVNLGEVFIDATTEQVAAATEWYITEIKDTGRRNTYVDCTVVLQRSRKAPNKTELLVTDYREGFFDNQRYREIPDMIAVDVEGDKVWVSKSCVKEVARGRLPFWA